jgi:ubiquinol-cytochrome c reductase cytochrome c1 subunit
MKQTALKWFPVLLIVSAVGGYQWLSHQHHESDALDPKKENWTFTSLTGTFKREDLQRGFQVYNEVCSSCHSLNELRYGNLAGKGKNIDEIRSSNLGLTMDEVKAIAAEHKVPDTDDDGQPIERKALPSDHFAKPYPNEKAARAANNGALPPDLSLIVKARKGGSDYVYSILTGYQDAPANLEIGLGRYYNPYFPGGQISMAPQLTDGRVTYADGTKATPEQMAKDVVTFLAWASEPELEERHQMGVKVLWYLLALSIVFFLAKRKIWADLKSSH